MQKSIDSVGPRPEKKKVQPLVTHKAGEVFRPRGAAPKAGESVKPKNYVEPKVEEQRSNTLPGHTGLEPGKKPKQPRKKISKRSKILVAIGLAVIFILGGLAWYIAQNTQFFASLTKPRPAAGVYAEVGGETYSESDYNKLKDDYASFSKKTGQSDTSQASQAAAKSITEGLALRAEARKQGIECTQAIVDSRLTDRYAERGGKDQYYAYLQAEYGWDASTVFWQECSSYLRQQLAAQIEGTDVYGVYIRWDPLINSDPTTRAAYEKAAQAKLEKDYLPLLQSTSVSTDEIERKLDIGKYITDAEYDRKMATPGEPYARSVSFARFNSATYAAMQKYDEGEDDLNYIAKLETGETTPVFKSKVGYYIAYRAVSKSGGQYKSIDQMIESYVQSGKYSNAYYALPSSANGANVDIYNIPKQQSSLDKVRQAVIPTARAANDITCFSGVHGLPFVLEYRDYDTRALIPLSASTGASVGISSTGNVRDSCRDEPGAGSYYGVVSIFYGGGGDINYIISPHANNPWNYGLSCYTAWRHVFNPPTGYQPVNYGDANQFEVLITSGFGVSSNYVASSEGGHFRVPSSLYSGVANGAFGYTIRVYMKRDTPPPPPLMTVNGYKVNEAGSASGPYSDNTVRLDGGAKTDNANPYSLPSIRADQNHTVTADNEPGMDIVGYKLNGGGLVASTTYSYGANAVGNGGTVRLDWVYRPKFTGSLAINCGTVSSTSTGPSGYTTFATIQDPVTGTSPQIGSGGSALSITVPDQYRDGLSRTVRLYARFQSVNYLVTSSTHQCNPNAACAAADFSQLGTAVDSGSSYKVTLSMSNNGEAIWGDYSSSNNYQLTPTAGTDGFDVDASTLTMQPPGSRIRTGQTQAFTVSVVAKLPVGSVTSFRLAFRMARVNSTTSPATVVPFGAECSTTVNVTVRELYYPWIRTQNGGVSALNKVLGQQEGSRGGRQASSTGIDFVKDATYAVLAQANTNYFCSSNAYLYGRVDKLAVNSCDFTGYTLAMYDTAKAIVSTGSKTSDVLYDTVEDLRTRSQCSGTPGTAITQFYANGGSINSYSGSNLLTGGCPTIYQFTGGSIGPVNISRGRGTLLVNGDLVINGDIRNLPNVVSYSQSDFSGINGLSNLGIIVRGDIIVSRNVKRIDASLYASGRIITCDAYANNTTTGFKDPAVPADLVSARQCALNPLDVKGLMVAKGGFVLGRNYVDFGAISGRIGQPTTSPLFDSIATDDKYYGRPAEDVTFNGLALILPPPGFEDLSKITDNKVKYLPNKYSPRF